MVFQWEKNIIISWKRHKKWTFENFWTHLEFFTKTSPRNSWSPHFMTPTFHDYSLEPKSQNAGTLCIWYWQTITTYLHRSLPKIRPCMSHIFQKSHRTRFRPGYFDMRILWIENELDLIWLTFCVLRLHKIWETLYLECYWH